MPDILHRVGIDASPAEILTALSTPEGLSHWWITGTTGEGNVGGTLHFRPGGGGFEMKVVKQSPTEVQWRCVGGPKEWVGTDVIFRLEQKEGETFVLFRHANWKEPVEFMHHCSTKWAVFLLSLKSWVERGEGRPHPYDVKIHVGD
jgi:uncharacterized protein YndB with AHSA1/START domain